jgi:DNA-directed RNA polymerase III subunit RPC1
MWSGSAAAIHPTGCNGSSVATDAWLLLLLCLQAVLGGNKGGLFGSLAADFSPAVAAAVMGRLAKMSARVMGDLGFSIGIDDVMPREQLLKEKAATLDKGYGSVQDYIGARLLSLCA